MVSDAAAAAASASAAAAARNDVSRTHGNFPKQRQVCVVGVVAGGKGWVGGGGAGGGGGGGQGGGGKV